MPDGTLPSLQQLPETEQPARGLFRFLINRNFALLAVGQAISNIGDFVYSTTVLIWVFALTHSAAAVSGILLAQYTPIFLLGPVAGVFVDRWNRRQTMIVSDLIRTVVALFPLVVPGLLRLPTIYVSVFLLSAFSRFFMPARAGVLQAIVPAEQQTIAASISQATFALSFVIGPALAAPLYFIVGPLLATIINALSFAVSALSLIFIRASKEALHPYAFAHTGQAAGGIRAVLGELFSGYRFIAKTRVLLMVTLLALIAMLGAGALNALEIIFVRYNLHVDASFYGVLVAAAGLGTLLGAITAGLLAKRIAPRHMLSGAVLLLGIGIIIYSLQTIFLIAVIINFIIAIPQGGIDVGFGPLLINSTPQIMIGRVQSGIETSMYGMSLISIGLAGYLGQFVPVNFIFAVGGALLAISGLFGWFAIPEPASKT